MRRGEPDAGSWRQAGIFAMKEKLKKLFTNVWNVPNTLTILRMVMIPVFAALFWTGHRKAALVVFCAASLTDLLDGYLARKLNQITDFGKLFDPLADKLMVLTALFCQAAAGVFPWVPTLIVLGKELLMVAGGAVLLGKGVVVYANYYGKVATVFFMASLILSFFHEELTAWGVRLDLIFLWISVALAILALCVYAAGAWKSWKEIRERS